MAPLSPQHPCPDCWPLTEPTGLPLAGCPSSRFGSEQHLNSPHTQFGEDRYLAPGNQLDKCTHQPHFKQEWPLLQPTPSTPLLCSSPASPPAQPPCICTVNLPTSWTLGFTSPTAAKSRFACGFSGAHQCEK